MNHPKFIQISAARSDQWRYLVALDSAGQVWEYDFANEKWVKLNG